MRLPLLFLALATSLSLAAQTALRPFQASPAATVTQDLGISTVKIEYHRPAVKGRKLWGGLVPFGEVWRAGANEATTITFSDPVKIAGQDLAAGCYSFFAIPGPDTWTLIFNRNPKLWGSNDYQASEDALRIQAKPQPAPFQECLAFTLEPAGPDSLGVALAWENLTVGFQLQLDARGLYWAHLEKALAQVKPGDWLTLQQAANYCLQSNLHLDKGMTWVDQSIQLRPGYRNLEIKARLLAKAGRQTEAVPLLRQALERATAAKAPKENLDSLHKALAEWGK